MQENKILKYFGWMLNDFILWLKRNKRYKFSPKYAGLNIGCGIDNPINWLGIDGGIAHVINKFPSLIKKIIFRLMNMSDLYSVQQFFEKMNGIEIIHWDVTNGLPFPENSIPAIYSSHFLEHLTKEGGEQFINECFRILVNGGIIRIVVPALEKERNEIKNALTYYEKGNTQLIQKYVTSDKYGFINKYSIHRHMYNYESLSNLLMRSGFKDILECKFKIGKIINVELLDTRDGLYIEAKKQIIS